MTAHSRTFWTVTFSLLLAASLIWAGANLHLQREGDTAATTAAIAPATEDTHTETETATEADDAVPAEEWVEIHGTVVAYEDNTLTIQTDTGETLEMGLGPLGYWLANGISFSPNDEVRVRGFYTDEFEPAEIENLTTGESVILRDADGSPLWRGSH